MARKASTIQALPPDILAQLQELLRDPRATQLDVTARINAVLEEKGHPDRVSKSAVNRYSQRMEEVGAKLRQSREVASMWIGKLGSQPQGEVGKLLNEMVRTLAFEMTMDMSEGTIEATPKMVKDLSIAIERLEKAASENEKRDEEIRRKAREEAADTAATLARKGGLSAATVDEIRRQILGVAS